MKWKTFWKVMFWLCIFCLALMLMATLVGCGEAEFAGGFASGVAAMTKISEDAQNKFVGAVNALEADTAKMNEMRAGLVLPVIKPEIIAAIEKVKGFKDNPWAWGALAGWLLNSGTLGAVVGRKLKKN